jgi:hypothetical protein
MGWYAISCRHSQSNCWDEAARVCPAGYETADESAHERISIVNGTGGSHYRGEMLVKCKTSAVKHAKGRPRVPPAPSAENNSEQPNDTGDDTDAGTSASPGRE